jgi:uncharacterized membrane protein YdjX (TVP38/TMEM64 family)
MSNRRANNTALRARTIVLALLGVVAVAIAVIAASHRLPDASAVTAWFASMRNAWYALPLVAVAYAVFGALLVPVILLIAATGVAFGPWLGPVYALVGSLASGSMGFGLGRLIGRHRVERLIGRRVPSLGPTMERHGPLAVLLIRKIPLPFILVNILIGASRVRYRDFLLGTMLGMAAAVIAVAGLGGTLLDLLQRPSPSVVAVAVALFALPLLGAWALNVFLTRKRRGRA